MTVLLIMETDGRDTIEKLSSLLFGRDGEKTAG